MRVIDELEKKLQSKEKELQEMKVKYEELEAKLKKSEESKFICIHIVLLVHCNIANMTGPNDEELRKVNFGSMLSRLTSEMIEPPDLDCCEVVDDGLYYVYPWQSDPLTTMKEILRGQSDPTDPSKPLIPLEVYDKAKDVKEFIYSLVPRYINYRNTSLLRSLVAKTRSYNLSFVTDYENNPLKKL